MDKKLVPPLAEERMINWTHEHAAQFGSMEQLEMALSNERVYRMKNRHEGTSRSWAAGCYTEKETIEAPFRYACIVQNQVWGRNHIDDSWMRCPAMDHLLKPVTNWNDNESSMSKFNTPYRQWVREKYGKDLDTLIDEKVVPPCGYRYSRWEEGLVSGKRMLMGSHDSNLWFFLCYEDDYSEWAAQERDKKVFPEGVDSLKLGRPVKVSDVRDIKPLPLLTEEEALELSRECGRGAYETLCAIKDQDVYFAEYEKIQAAADASEDFNSRVMRGFNEGMAAVDKFRQALGDDTPFKSYVRSLESEPLSVCCKAPTFIDGTRRICEKCRCSRPI